MKKLYGTIGLFLFAHCALATPYVTNVVAKQRYPWNGKVDVYYEVVGDFGKRELEVSAMDMSSGEKYFAYDLEGDVHPRAGFHHVVWDLIQQGVSIKSERVVFSVSYEALYKVVDIGDAYVLDNPKPGVIFSVEELEEVPSGGWTDEHRTSKLVLRRCRAGADPLGRYVLTNPFYISVFEVTRAQWTRVFNGGYTQIYPSDYNVNLTNMIPASVSWDRVHGAPYPDELIWPASSEVAAWSFLRYLRDRTGSVGFDLPTSAQWEYACRAGTKTTRYYGDQTDWKSFGATAWNGWTEGESVQKGGLKAPNQWGLYDLYGNLDEWCLDACAVDGYLSSFDYIVGARWNATLSAYIQGLMIGINPKGDPTVSTTISRFVRGGSCNDDWLKVSSGTINKKGTSANAGFRVCLNIK